jgi:hypothetical protein
MGLTRARSEHQMLVRGIEVYLGADLVGAVVPVPVPGQEPTDPFNPACNYVGWVHDWEDDSPGFRPLCIGITDDPESLFTEIERRVREATV